MAEELGTKVEERPRDVPSRPSCGYDFPVTSSRTAGSVHNQRRERTGQLETSAGERKGKQISNYHGDRTRGSRVYKRNQPPIIYSFIAEMYCKELLLGS